MITVREADDNGTIDSGITDAFGTLFQYPSDAERTHT